MSNKNIVTEQEKLDIVAAYKSGMKLKELARVMGRSPTTVSIILEEKGERKIVRTGPKTKKKIVICPKCKATGNVKGAKFCYKCGVDIRTESDILRERLGKLISDFQFLPESARDNAYTVVQDAIDYLRKECK